MKHFPISAVCLAAFACGGARALAGDAATIFEKQISDTAKIVATRSEVNPPQGATDQECASLNFEIHLIHGGRDETLRAFRTLKTNDPADQQEKLSVFDATATQDWGFVVYAFHNKIAVDCFKPDGGGTPWSYQIGRLTPGMAVVKHPGFLLAGGELRVVYEVQGKEDERNEWHFLEMNGHLPDWEKLPGKNDPPPALKTRFIEAMSNPDETGLLNSLIASGVPVDTRDAGGRTAAMEMARLGALNELKYLISKGADPSAVDNDGNDALFHAIRNRQTEVMNYLLSIGANVNATNDDGASELERAIADPGDQQIAAFLIAHGARLDIRDKEGDNAAIYAVLADHPAILIMLVGKGADPNVKDIYGRSAAVPNPAPARASGAQ